LRKFRNLEAYLDRITAGPDVWIPPWLTAVGSREEIAEWKAIQRTYRGPDLRDRELEFQREMRKQHPDMPPTIDEIVEEGGRKYAEEHASSKEPATQELEK
jgi:hypothetical protein